MKSKTAGSGRSRARRAASQALYQWLMTGDDPAEIEAQFTADRPMENVDLEYFHLLLHDVVKNSQALDETLAPNLDRPLAQLDPVEHSILRIGCYELGYRKDVPMRVVINESIELAKVFGADQSHKFINSVLDRIARTVRVDGL
jgi:N utilization substance protein B